MFAPDTARPGNSLLEFPRRQQFSRAARRLSVLAAALLLAMTGIATVRAGFNVITGDRVQLLDGGPGFPGGVFSIDVLGRGTTSDFETFCVEMTEDVAFGPTYYVDHIGLATIGGNKPLGPQAAWLYTQFLDRNDSKLSGFNFVNPSPAVARDQQNALQLGIWCGMGYTEPDIIHLSGWGASYVDFTLLPMLSSSLLNFQSDLANNLWSGTGNIEIMSLRTFTTRPDGSVRLVDYAQDQLVRRDPLELRQTPELPTIYSAASVMGGALLLRIFWFIRKRSLSTVGA
jgi:hypothetical protein